ncbi:hypothetical protein [Salipaludibacillus aurantiacus]|nr:hypothetical protein [Salipaludibacillus aurantiacus]
MARSTDSTTCASGPYTVVPLSQSRPVPRLRAPILNIKLFSSQG